MPRNNSSARRDERRFAAALRNGFSSVTNYLLAERSRSQEGQRRVEAGRSNVKLVLVGQDIPRGTLTEADVLEMLVR